MADDMSIDEALAQGAVLERTSDRFHLDSLLVRREAITVSWFIGERQGQDFVPHELKSKTWDADETAVLLGTQVAQSLIAALKAKLRQEGEI